jgi:hypothetical protein
MMTVVGLLMTLTVAQDLLEVVEDVGQKKETRLQTMIMVLVHHLANAKNRL